MSRRIFRMYGVFTSAQIFFYKHFIYMFKNKDRFSVRTINNSHHIRTYSDYLTTQKLKNCSNTNNSKNTLPQKPTTYLNFLWKYSFLKIEGLYFTRILIRRRVKLWVSPSRRSSNQSNGLRMLAGSIKFIFILVIQTTVSDWA